MRTMILAAMVLGSACGAVQSPDTAAWENEVAQSRQQVVSYRGTIVATASTSDCVEQRDRYAEKLRPMMSRMREMSGGFDDCFGAMGRMGYADVEPMCADMDFELNRYGSAGCGSTDSDTNRADGLEHCRRMLDFLDRATSRSRSMSDMMGGHMGGSCR